MFYTHIYTYLYIYNYTYKYILTYKCINLIYRLYVKTIVANITYEQYSEISIYLFLFILLFLPKGLRAYREK